jgi:predicted RNase H-like HicB family nuclease
MSRASLATVGEPLHLTIRYSDGGDGWIMAQVEEVPGAISQGRTRPEARENAIDALRLMLQPEPGDASDPDREPLGLELIA